MRIFISILFLLFSLYSYSQTVELYPGWRVDVTSIVTTSDSTYNVSFSINHPYNTYNGNDVQLNDVLYTNSISYGDDCNEYIVTNIIDQFAGELVVTVTDRLSQGIPAQGIGVLVRLSESGLTHWIANVGDPLNQCISAKLAGSIENKFVDIENQIDSIYAGTFSMYISDSISTAQLITEDTMFIIGDAVQLDGNRFRIITPSAVVDTNTFLLYVDSAGVKTDSIFGGDTIFIPASTGGTLDTFVSKDSFYVNNGDSIIFVQQGDTIVLPTFTDTDQQNLSLVNDSLLIERGTGVDLSIYRDTFIDTNTDTDSIYFNNGDTTILILRKDTIFAGIADTTNYLPQDSFLVSFKSGYLYDADDTTAVKPIVIDNDIYFQLNEEAVEDVVAEMFNNQIHENITITYDDSEASNLILRAVDTSGRNQSLTITNDTLFLTDADTTLKVLLPEDLVFDGDSSVTNELQDIDSIVLLDNLLTVYISNGASASVNLSGYSPTDRADTSGYNLTFQLNGNDLELTDADGTLSANLSAYLDNTDTDSIYVNNKGQLFLLKRNDILYIIDNFNYPEGYVHCADSTEVVDVVSNTGKIWMDRNLGASKVAVNVSDPNGFGDLFQWGRAADGHQCRNSTTTTTIATTFEPNLGNEWDGKFIVADFNSNYNWLNTTNNNLWQGIEGTNNPCPNGYKIPTRAEWQEEIASWSSSNRAGAYDSPLKLTTAGWKLSSSGSIQNESFQAQYWTSSVSNIFAYQTFITSVNTGTSTGHRAYGNSVRCIKADALTIIDTDTNTDTDTLYFKIGETYYRQTRNDTLNIPVAIDTSYSSGDTLFLVSGGDTLLIELNVTGDQWGGQVAETDVTIDGNGLLASPLKIARQGAAQDQVLKWDEFADNWVIGDDNKVKIFTFDTDNGALQIFHTDDSGISTNLDGRYLRFEQDSSTTNELQNLTRSADSIFISDGTGIDITNLYDNTDISGRNTSLTLVNDTLKLTDDLSTLQVYIPSAIDTSYAIGNTLYFVSGGDTSEVVIDVPGDDWGNDTVNIGTGLTGNGTPEDPLSVVFPPDETFDGDSSITNEIQTLSIESTGRIFTITLDNGGGIIKFEDTFTDADSDTLNEGFLSVLPGTDLTSILQSNTGNNNAITFIAGDGISLSEGSNSITIEATGGTNTDTDSIYIDLNGTVSLITRGDTIELTTVTNTDNQNLDSAILNGTQLTIYIQGGNSTTVDLANLQDGYEPNTDTDSIYIDSDGVVTLLERGDTIVLSTLVNTNTDSIYFNNRSTIELIRQGDTITLPPDLVDDLDADPNNEIQSITVTPLANGNDLIQLSPNGGTYTIIDNVNDADSLPTNELQNLSRVGDSIKISNGTGVYITDFFDNTDNSGYNSSLSLSNDTLYLTDDNSTLQVYIPSAIDTSFSSGDTLFLISSGDTTTVILDVPGDGDNQTLSLANTTLSITGGNSVNLSDFLDNTDGDTIVVDSAGVKTYTVTRNGTIYIPAGDGTGTDDQQISEFAIASNNLNLTLEGDATGQKTVNLSPYLDNTDSQQLSWNEGTRTLSLDSSVSVVIADNINDADSDPSNEIQTLSWASGANGQDEIALSNGGGTITITDDWGSQVVTSDATLTGDGTSASNLKIAQQGATLNQVLKWNGATWLPDDDTDEQGLSLVQLNTNIYSIDIDNSSDDFVIQGDNGITLSAPIPGVDQLKISGPGQGNGIGIYANDLFVDSENLTEAGTLSAADFFVIDDANVGGASLSTRKISPANLRLSLMNNDAGFITTQTDDQTIDVFNLTGTDLNLSLESDGEATKTVSLASLQDGNGIYDSNNDNSTAAVQNIGVSTFLNFDANTFYIDGTNNEIGIGTTTPNQKLHVVGTTEIDGRLDLDDGNTSVYIGNLAGVNSTASATGNVFVGKSSGTTNTDGYHNTFLGFESGKFNTTGYRNTAVGYQSGEDITTAQENTLLGFQSGRNVTTGNYNTFFGVASGDQITTGTRNNMIGHETGKQLTDAQDNTFIGYRAGHLLNAGNKNVFIGSLAGATDFGESSVTGLDSASNSIFIGYNTKSNVDTITNTIVIGHDSHGNGTNTTRIGNYSTTKTYLDGELYIDNINYSAHSTEVLIGGSPVQKRSVNQIGFPFSQYTANEGSSVTVDFQNNSKHIVKISCTGVSSAFTLNTSNVFSTAQFAAVYNIHFHAVPNNAITVTLDAGKTWYNEVGNQITTITLQANQDKIMTFYTSDGINFYTME